MTYRPDQCTRMVKLPVVFTFEAEYCRCALAYGHDGLHRGLLDQNLVEIEVQQFDEDVAIYRGGVMVGFTWESKDTREDVP